MTPPPPPSDERDGFYDAFWATPELPTPHIKADVAATESLTTNDPLPLSAQMVDVRLVLKNRLKLLELTREEELVKAIETCKQYCRLLRAHEFYATQEVICRWKSCFTSETIDMPVLFELPMVLFTRAILLLNQAKCVSRSRDREKIPQAAALCLEAAGIFDHILELMNTNLMEGLEPPSSLPDLSLDVLQSLQGVCLAIAQQLSIVKAVLHFDKQYSKSVLVKLHGGCQASFQIFEAALLRNCASPSCHAKTLLSFASFFGKLHKAQAFLLSAEVDYQMRRFGRAIAFAEVARKLFQERTSIGGLGLPPLPSSCERNSPILMTKRAALDQLYETWVKENDSIYFDSIPAEDSVVATTLPQAFIMKPQPFDSLKNDEQLSSSSSSSLVKTEGSLLNPLLPPRSSGQSHESVDHHDEVAAALLRIQVIDEQSDDENEATSAGETEVYLERVDIAERRTFTLVAGASSEQGQALVQAQALAQAQVQAQDQAPALQPTRQSLINALSDALLSTHPANAEETPAAPPTRRQSERAPSMTVSQIAEIAKKSSRRKKFEGFEYKTEAIAVQECLKMMQPLQPLAELRRLSTQSAAVLSPTLTAPGGTDSDQPQLQMNTSEVDQRMHSELRQGKPIFRLAKDTRWRKEMMFLVDDELVFMRKKPLLFSTQKKVSWSTIAAIQLEQGEIKDTHFILIVAQKGEEMTPFEVTTNPPADNGPLFNYLQRLFQERRKKSVLQEGGTFRTLQRQHTIS